MTQVFISYAHADLEHVKAFELHFKPVAAKLKLTVWRDDRLTGGQIWDLAIRREISKSDIFILLVSNAFLASNYIMGTELPAIRATQRRGALLLPVIVEPSHWQDEFSAIQCLPKDDQLALKPMDAWPRNDGRHAASAQARAAIEKWRAEPPGIPTLSRGPDFVVTPQGFDFAGTTTSAQERNDPRQRSLFAQLHARAGRIGRTVNAQSNYLLELGEELDDYRRILGSDIEELDAVALQSAGHGLRLMTDTIEKALGNSADPDLQIPALQAMLLDHDAFVTGFKETRQAAILAAFARSLLGDIGEIGELARQVLYSMGRQSGLLADQARALVNSLHRALENVTEEGVVVIEAALQTSAAAVVSIARALYGPLVKVGVLGGAAQYISSLAGDPNLTVLRAALSYLSENAGSIGALIANHEEARRLIVWVVERVKGVGPNSMSKPPPLKFPEPLPGGGFAPDMVIIPACPQGFLMGADEETEGVLTPIPQRFAMGRHAVTFAEYDAFCADTKRKKPKDRGWGRGRRPVINVSWHDAMAYVGWLNDKLAGRAEGPYRLPTEAEWEYACRGDASGQNRTNFSPEVAVKHAGRAIEADEANFDGSKAWNGSATGEYREQTVPVDFAGFRPNGFRLMQMHGNVWEWCADVYDKNPGDKNPENANRVLRGGYWVNNPQNLRSANRNGNRPDNRNNDIGFRLSRTL